jgi:hypothetical protein
MPILLADHDVEGHLRVLTAVWTSDDWLELWQWLGCSVESLASLGFAADLPDSKIWQLCQHRGMILITGNRNAEGEESLEVTMRKLAAPNSLPVLTIGDPNRVMTDGEYAERVAVQILDILLDIERYRGTRRVFVP